MLFFRMAKKSHCMLRPSLSTRCNLELQPFIFSLERQNVLKVKSNLIRNMELI